MNHSTKKSGATLMVMGLLGAVFFWALDPRWGVVRYLWKDGQSYNLVDESNAAMAGTIVGVAASLVIMLLGLWLISRRRV